MKALAAVVFMVLIAAACSSDGYPTGFDEAGANEGLVERNWLEGCLVDLTEDLAEEANSVCQCSYNEISGPDGIPFAEFETLNNSLKDDPTNLTGESLTANGTKLVDIVKGCIAGG